MPGAPVAAARVALAATATAAFAKDALTGWWQSSHCSRARTFGMVNGASRPLSSFRTSTNMPSPMWANDQGNSTFTLNSAARCVPKPLSIASLRGNQLYKCGDDAFFLATPTAVSATIGIADGVGGWSRRGVDPARFSWELMASCKSEAEGGMDNPRSLIELGYEKMLKKKDVPIGGCTVCVASLNRNNGELHVANLGDSGVMLIRGDGQCVLESTAQHHGFNCPYQLGVEPISARPCGDHPKNADVYSAQAKEGDLLVLATDGFLDNVFRDEWLDAIAVLRDAKPSEIAEMLVRLAQKKSLAAELSPFSAEAARHGVRHDGGKPDDITVIVARIEQVASKVSA